MASRQERAGDRKEQRTVENNGVKMEGDKALEKTKVGDKVRGKVRELFGRKEDHTHVDTSFAAPVVQEHRFVHKHEDVTEVHNYEHEIDHYQLRIQPIVDESHFKVEDTQVLDTKTHEHKPMGGPDVERTFAEVRDGFKDSMSLHDRNVTQVINDMQENHHSHHHVREVVQPVVHKKIVTHEYIHTVDPHTHKVIETPIVHETTINEPMTRDEFERTDLAFRHRTHAGAPRSEDQAGATTTTTTTTSGTSANHV